MQLLSLSLSALVLQNSSALMFQLFLLIGRIATKLIQNMLKFIIRYILIKIKNLNRNISTHHAKTLLGLPYGVVLKKYYIFYKYPPLCLGRSFSKDRVHLDAWQQITLWWKGLDIDERNMIYHISHTTLHLVSSPPPKKKKGLYAVQFFNDKTHMRIMFWNYVNLKRSCVYIQKDWINWKGTLSMKTQERGIEKVRLHIGFHIFNCESTIGPRLISSNMGYLPNLRHEDAPKDDF